MTTTGAEDGAKMQCREDGEEESEEPVGEPDGAKGARFSLVSKEVAEAQKRGGSGLWDQIHDGAESVLPRGQTRGIAPSVLRMGDYHIESTIGNAMPRV